MRSLLQVISRRRANSASLIFVGNEREAVASAEIFTNCCVIGRAEAFAFKHGVAKSAVDGIATGLGFMLALVLLGAMREILGQGTLLGQAELLFGEFGKNLTLHLVDDYRGFLLAILPPGAFIGLGCLIALKNVLDARAKRRLEPKPVVVLQEAGT